MPGRAAQSPDRKWEDTRSWSRRTSTTGKISSTVRSRPTQSASLGKSLAQYAGRCALLKWKGHDEATVARPERIPRRLATNGSAHESSTQRMTTWFRWSRPSPTNLVCSASSAPSSTSHCALQLGQPRSRLHGSDVLRPAVDQGRLCTPEFLFSMPAAANHLTARASPVYPDPCAP
jgi:hypothetical protein